MLPEILKGVETAEAVERFDAAAIEGGGHDAGETMLMIKAESIGGVCRFLKKERGFERLSGLFGIDRYPMEPRFEVVYLLHSISRNERLKLKVALPGGAAEVESVTGVWAGANWYERETYDMFGVVFRNHPLLERLLMPEYWEGHPLRKDFPTHGHKYSYQNE